jgi:putative phosphoribosyl transferase
MLFADRFEAGRVLASRLAEFAHREDVVVLALPRGGVPVGFEVARALHAPLDVFVVRKLGVPGHEELAMGAIASGGVRVSIIVTHGDDEHTETQAYRLVGINADHAGGRHKIRVSVVRGDGARLTHRVKHPINVTLPRDLKGAHEGLDIISADGARTRVRFRVAASPEMLDGLLPDMQHEAASRKPSVGHRQSLRPEIQEKEVHIPIDGIMLDASLVLPQAARGVVLFAHGSGSSRLSPRNRYVANVLQNAGFGALLMDLLTVKEEAFDQQTAALI